MTDCTTHAVPLHTSHIILPQVLDSESQLLQDGALTHAMKSLEVSERPVQRSWGGRVLGRVKEKEPGAGVNKEARDRP